MDVFILAAGRGTRMANTLWPDVPKCLLPYQGKAILAHVIDSFIKWGPGAPKWLPGPPVFYVAVPEGDCLIQSYVHATYGNSLNIRFVEVRNIGAGPLHSFMELAMFRDTNDPFVVTVSDCVLPLAAKDHLPHGNYLGCAIVSSHLQVDYLNMVLRSGSTPEFVEKASVTPGVTAFSWSGLAIIADAREYQLHVADLLEEFDKDPRSEVSYAALFSTFKVSSRSQSVRMTYQDFVDLGTSDKYAAATKEQNVCAKGDQITYTGARTDRVVKYFKNQEHALGFYHRGVHLHDLIYVPENLVRHNNFVSYVRAPGESLTTLSTDMLLALLNDLYTILWKSQERPYWVLLQRAKPKVTPLCLFADKTRERLEVFHQKTGTNVDTWLSLLERFEWRAPRYTKIGRIHGDLTLDNILYDAVSDTFIFIDWRPATCTDPGSLYGDVYYDLAKLWLSLFLDLNATRKSGTGQPVIRGDANLLTSFQAWCKINTFDDVFDYDTVIRNAILLMAAMSGVHSEPIASGFYHLSLRLAQHVDAGNSL